MNNCIDLNCDMGEGQANDASLMPLISSANIACGFHAGDAYTMHKTIALALENSVAIGAHPGFNDKANFGRTEMQLSKEALFELVSVQLENIQKIALSLGTSLHHVKPHGALYNMAARDAAMAKTIAAAIFAFNPHLILYGLSSSHLIIEGKAQQLITASEVFADRTYQNDGSLTPRSQTNAMIETDEQSMKQVLQMIQHKTVTSTQQQTVSILAETICVHGDGKNAVAFAKNMQLLLQANNITIQPR